MDQALRQAQRHASPAELDHLARRAGQPTQRDRLLATLRRWDTRSRDLTVDWHTATDERERVRVGALVRVYGLAAQYLLEHLDGRRPGEGEAAT